MEHRAADDAAARDHRLAEAAILREATVASMVAKQAAGKQNESADGRRRRKWMMAMAWMCGRGIKVRHHDGYRKTKKTGSSNRKGKTENQLL